MATVIYRTLLLNSRAKGSDSIAQCVGLQRRRLAQPSSTQFQCWPAPASYSRPASCLHRQPPSTVTAKFLFHVTLEESPAKASPTGRRCHLCCGRSRFLSSSSNIRKPDPILGSCTTTTKAAVAKNGGAVTATPSTPLRPIHSCGGALYAGHNKWSKVKYIKGPKDIEKSRMFTKIGMQVKIAVKEGGSNPETNSALASVISFAKTKAMPRATLDTMIKKAAASKQGDTEQTLEVRGPGNSSLLVNVLTDNPKRTRTEITHLANKNGGVLGEHGTAMFAFQRKGVLRVPCEVEGQRSMHFDDAEELAIEIGAEEVKEGTDVEGQSIFMFICDPSELRLVRDGLHAYPLLASGHEFVAVTTMPLSDSDMEAAANLINALEDHEHVVKVFDNIVSKE